MITEKKANMKVKPTLTPLILNLSLKVDILQFYVNSFSLLPTRVCVTAHVCMQMCAHTCASACVHVHVAGAAMLDPLFGGGC